MLQFIKQLLCNHMYGKFLTNNGHGGYKRYCIKCGLKAK